MNAVTKFLYRLPLMDRTMDLLRSQPARKRTHLKHKLHHELHAFESPARSINFEKGSDKQSPWLVGVRIKDGGIVLSIAPRVERSRVYWYLYDRLPCVLYLAKLAVENISFAVDVSDGHKGFTDVLGFSGNQGSVWLIPDPDFFNNHGYANLRQRPSPNWSERSSEITWRGAANGQGLISNATMSADDDTLRQRVRMCLLFREHAGIDAKLILSDRTEDLSSDDSRLLEQADIIGQATDISQWWHRRFAIDIDGYTNAWSGLFTRLLMGCCVLKVASPTGHRQWYYHRLEPWHHYIPVSADLSDLEQRIDWCLRHECECEQIANRGRALALSMDFKSEYHQAAADLVNSGQVSVSL